jgi:hypothetical protein
VNGPAKKEYAAVRKMLRRDAPFPARERNR